MVTIQFQSPNEGVIDRFLQFLRSENIEFSYQTDNQTDNQAVDKAFLAAFEESVKWAATKPKGTIRKSAADLIAEIKAENAVAYAD